MHPRVHSLDDALRSLALKDVPSFIKKLYQLLHDPVYVSYFAWSSAGSVFAVYNQKELTRHILPHFFKQSQFQSFLRQLNIYIFQRVVAKDAPSELVRDGAIYFTHAIFCRNSHEELHRIKRRIKPSAQGHNPSSFVPMMLSLSGSLPSLSSPPFLSDGKPALQDALFDSHCSADLVNAGLSAQQLSSGISCPVSNTCASVDDNNKSHLLSTSLNKSFITSNSNTSTTIKTRRSRQRLNKFSSDGLGRNSTTSTSADALVIETSDVEGVETEDMDIDSSNFEADYSAAVLKDRIDSLRKLQVKVTEDTSALNHLTNNDVLIGTKTIRDGVLQRRQHLEGLCLKFMRLYPQRKQYFVDAMSHYKAIVSGEMSLDLQQQARHDAFVNNGIYNGECQPWLNSSKNNNHAFTINTITNNLYSPHPPPTLSNSQTILLSTDQNLPSTPFGNIINEYDVDVPDDMLIDNYEQQALHTHSMINNLQSQWREQAELNNLFTSEIQPQRQMMSDQDRYFS